jgi:hypothetical protein
LSDVEPHVGDLVLSESVQERVDLLAEAVCWNLRFKVLESDQRCESVEVVLLILVRD